MLPTWYLGLGLTHQDTKPCLVLRVQQKADKRLTHACKTHEHRSCDKHKNYSPSVGGGATQYRAPSSHVEHTWVRPAPGRCGPQGMMTERDTTSGIEKEVQEVGMARILQTQPVEQQWLLGFPGKRTNALSNKQHSPYSWHIRLPCKCKEL